MKYSRHCPNINTILKIFIAAFESIANGKALHIPQTITAEGTSVEY